MVSLLFLFWMYVVLFAVIGGMRGWAKEILVTFSVILAIFIITTLERFVPFMRDAIVGAPRFWIRTIIILALVFFGYQGPNIPRLAGNNRFVRERLQDILLGIFLGAINGFLIFGSVWFFLNEAQYPFELISAPDSATSVGQTALGMIKFLPPTWLGAPAIYFAVALAFVFVLVVFV
ncbi:MAG TPA: hypothetical protein VF326_11565 [Anaerolineaceae bacterium]|jgi:hypothetical protein